MSVLELSMIYNGREFKNVTNIVEFGDGKMLVGCVEFDGVIALTFSPSEEAMPINRITREMVDLADKGELPPNTTMYVFKNMESFDVVLDRLMIMRLMKRGWNIEPAESHIMEVKK